MSDPVTNVEIEDVLSSIRRLVSEGDKAKRAEKAPEPAKSDTPEKLVLTPALRVAADRDDSDDQPAESEPPQAVAPTLVEDTPMAFVAAETPDEDEEISDEVPFDRAKLEEGNIPFDRANLEATIAELEAAVTEQSDEWEPDGSDTNLDPTWAAAGFASDQPVEDAEEITDDPVEQASVEVLQPELRVDLEDQAEVSTEVEDEAAPEADGGVEAESNVETAPAIDAVTEPDEIVPPLTFRHGAQDAPDEDHGDDLRGGDDASDADPVADDELAAYLADDTVIDEDMLRQMVLEIVRSELQGKLGERITRNVRKLVRREIHRVLTSQDID